MQDFEKLGVFYLGRSYDEKAKQPRPDLILYDSRDLVTHAVCVGMTGSGKTGLCLTLLEEAAIDGIPVLAIDPKGDLANLLLTFPQLRGADFAPWINEDDARKAGLTPEAYAEQQAERWRKGLAEWGQDGARIQRLRDAADFAVYTPGSNAGLPVSVLKSFDAPEPSILADGEMLRERTGTTTTSLLGLLGIAADPVQSREHILIATILGTTWKQGQSLDLPGLIQQIQSPPFSKVGVLDLESFFPAKDRFGLAMALNNLLASPGFDAWMQGEPLNLNALLYTPQGKPRVCIFSIAHLGDAERMFFVALLLNQVLGWMRTQPGTTSLRALVYMDEIFGYLPPVANPPSKAPMLTLLKQARAFGVGLVLATQNPVDLDYKALSNTGTWFVGRLQTDRDKARLLDGLEGAATAGKFDRANMEQTLAGLGNRIFLMHNVHDDAPVVLQVRWALCYLRGPLTRSQIKTLMDGRRLPAAAGTETPAAALAASRSAVAAPAAPESAGQRPVLPPEVPQCFLPVRVGPPDGGRLLYAPKVLGCGQIYFHDAKAGVDVTHTVTLLAELALEASAPTWEEAAPADLAEADLKQQPVADAVFNGVPPAAAKGKNYAAWKKTFTDALYRRQKVELFKSVRLGELSRPGEAERDFRIRLQQKAREERDQQAAKLRQKYAPRIATLQERIRKAQQAVEREETQSEQSMLQTTISFGATVLGAFLGRKKISATTVGKATTAARGAGRSMKESRDVARARENLRDLEQQLAKLEAKFEAEVEEMETKLDPLTEALELVAIRPKKTNISTRLLVLAWVPWWLGKDGSATFALE